MRNIFLILFLTLSLNAFGQSPIQYDIVLTGGRVIDPETKLDAIRNVGIQGGRIMMVSSDPLVGKETLNVSGMVVSPGFIDLHVHGMGNIELNTNSMMGSRRLWSSNGESNIPVLGMLHVRAMH